MKRTVLTLFSMLIACSLFAQKNVYPEWNDERHNLYLSVGTPSAESALINLIIAIPEALAEHPDNTILYGHYCLQYHYQVLPWLRVGAKGDWEGSRYLSYQEKEKINQKAVVHKHAAALTASCQFTYFNRQHVKLYSGLDAGAMAYIFDRKFSEGYTPSENEAALDCTWLPAINLTVLGVNAGGKHVWGLAELNLGSDAIFRAGIGVQF